MGYFIFKLNRIKIFKNREIGKSEIKILSFVTGDDVNLPNLDNLLKTTDVTEKRKIIKEAAKSVLSSKELIEVHNVKDGHELTFGDTGYALYEARVIPQSFNWSLLVLEIDEDLNELGKRIDDIVSADGFDGVVKNVMEVVGASANPTAAAGAAIAKFVVQAVAVSLKKNKDDQVGIAYQTFVRQLDYPHGEKKKNNVPDLSNNILIDYQIFGMS